MATKQKDSYKNKPGIRPQQTILSYVQQIFRQIDRQTAAVYKGLW